MKFIVPVFLVFMARLPAGACEFGEVLKCLPVSNYEECKSYVSNWGSADQKSSILILDRNFFSVPGHYDVSLSRVVDDGVTAYLGVYGCYSRAHFEEEGRLSWHSDRLIFFTGTDRKKPVVYYPPSNPGWGRGEPLVVYEKIGLYAFKGDGSDKDKTAHVYFVKRKDTGENPCCGGGFFESKEEVLGFYVSATTVREVYRGVVESEDNQLDDYGCGTLDIVHSTFTVDSASNTITISGDNIHSVYESSVPDIPGQEPHEGVEKERKVHPFVNTWRWDGAGFFKLPNDQPYAPKR